MKPYYEDTTSGIVIYHGDCREILPHLPKADLVLTDPPYGLYACGGTWGAKESLQWDKQPAQNINQVLAAGNQAVIWGGNYFSLPPSRGWLVWYKRDAVPSAADVELAWTSKDFNSQLFDWPIAATNAERVGHPTQKPLSLISWCLKLFPDSRSVVDPFMGSGTTLRAAKDHGRRVIGIELEEKYCEMAARRLAQEVLSFA